MRYGILGQISVLSKVASQEVRFDTIQQCGV
jgi:hypothetical protein